MDIELCVIDYQSPAYQQVLELRNEVLRQPLGLNLFDEDLMEDRDQYIIIALLETKVVACLMLKIIDKDTVKLRQMAVTTELQANGIGHTLVKYAENFCILNEYSIMELHARKAVLPFYEKMDYLQQGDEFEEVGIPHYKMVKILK